MYYSFFIRSVSIDLSLSDKGQSSAPTYEMVPGTFEEITVLSSREVREQYENVRECEWQIVKAMELERTKHNLAIVTVD